MSQSNRPAVSQRLAHLAPYLVVVLLALPAAARWLRADLPAGADTAIHLFRAVQLDWAVRNGYLYPRWAPDLAYGFGYPLFLVHGPTIQYVIAGLHALGLSFLSATLGSFALADLAGALGAFSLARLILGSTRAGLLAACAYAYSPYILGSLYRGSPAEALALGLLPWLLWAFYGLEHAPTPRRLALAAGLFALFPLLHNPSAVLASGTLAVFVLALSLSGARRSPRAALAAARPALLAIALGLGLSAFYWLPVVFETRFIQIERAYEPNVLNFRFNFLSLRELLAPPVAFDPRLIGWHAPRSYGWPQIALALLGIGLWPARLGRSAPLGLLLTLAAAGVLGLGFLTLPQSLPTWENLPGLSLIQFPARLLGPASLLLALLGAAAFASTSFNLRSGNRHPFASGETVPDLLVTAACLAIALYGLAWTFQFPDPLVPANPSIADMQAFEQRTGALGTTTAGEYLPIWVEQLPPAESLRERYLAGPIINRLSLASLPDGAQVRQQVPGLIRQQVTLDTPTAFTAVFDVFYFPGWQGWVDGQPVPLSPTQPHGLISLPVPAGAHTLELRFGSTPARTLAGWLALAALLALAVVLVRGWRIPNPADAWPAAAPARPALLAVLGLAGLSLFVLKIAVLDQRETVYARTRFDGATVAGLPVPLSHDFAGQLQLLGYEPAGASAPSGGTLDVTLYWRALQPLSADYSTVLALVDADGHSVAQSDSQHPAGFPTSRWPVESYARDAHRLSLLPGTPPGVYTLVANVYHPDSLAALSVDKPLGQVSITRPRRPAVLIPGQRLDARLGPVTLLGADATPADVAVGADLPLTLYWRVDTAPTEDLQLRLSLTSGAETFAQVLPPVRADYPSRQWQPGETLRAPLRVRVPAAAPGGQYQLSLELLGESGPLGQPIALGEITISAPERRYDLPPLPNAASARFGSLAELIGWQLDAGDDDASTLTLHWRALATADARYSVFVHVLDASGQIFSQRDFAPAGGARPTTSWLPGEIIADSYRLDLPPAHFSLRLGLYNPLTGERLTLPEGEEFVILEP